MIVVRYESISEAKHKIIFNEVLIMQNKRKIAVAVTGASGSIYALRLIEKLLQLSTVEVAVIVSETAKSVAKHELGSDILLEQNVKYFDVNSFYAPCASGSSDYDTLLVAPCSVGTMARIAQGTADNLIVRTADVMLKERRKLILLLRETPFSLIHIENMRLITLAGGIIMPASPSFYHKPASLNEVIDSMINRLLDVAQIESSIKRWNP